MNHLPLVTVIVVNYNGKHFLKDCLNSLANQTYPQHRVEVIVVDNNSTDGSAAFLRQEFPWVRTINAGKNLGFAAGNNLGLSIARGEWVALLNNDAIAEPDWLQASVESGVLADDIGGVAGHIVFANDPNRINSTGLVVLTDGRGADRDVGKLDSEVRRPRGEVFGGCGAGLVLRRAMLDELGLFDPKLFMYYEDLDLAWRARSAGWRFVYEPKARVRHVFGGSAGVESPFQNRYVERNRCLVNLRHAPLHIAVGTVLGGFARTVRSVWKQPSSAPATVVNFATTMAMSWRPVLARLQSRCNRRGLPMSSLRSWIGRGV